ncbi:YdcF family protein [Alteromonas halophila]|uniref:DUF218 domain-containing protein n=1 Tax=Alteromonas halophila TaxID=516698 RepID=A0A918JIN3_9ALTE|nr:YdcF family protein [Alteromonas halophila]GGW83095.1 hypothetical protein GCM10007391_15460 [Alteromonas halophila]
MNHNERIAIFGSRVLEDGTPSGSLLRRTLGGLEAAKTMMSPGFFVTGGTSDERIPTEAAVMKDVLLENGIDASDILCDHDSKDTLASVLALHAQVSTSEHIFVCSDNYHVLRIVFLLFILGRKATPLWIVSGHTKTGVINWAYMWAREVVASVYDGVVLAWRRLTKGIST